MNRIDTIYKQMKNRKIIAFIAAICLGTLLAAGCGEPVGTSSQPGETTTSQTTEPSAWTGDLTQMSQSEPEILNIRTREDLDAAGDLTGADLEAMSTTYSIWMMDEHPYTFNSLGVLLGTSDIQVYPLKDGCTGEIVYYKLCYKILEKTGEYTYDTTMMSRLYDPEGKLLVDWEEMDYEEGYGDWILAHKYVDYMMEMPEDSQLLNPKTGERISGVWRAMALGASHGAIGTRDWNFTQIRDLDGKLVKNLGNALNVSGVEGNIYLYKNYLVVDYCMGSADYSLSFFREDGSRAGYLSNQVSDDYYYDTVLMPYVRVGNCIYDPSQGNGGELQPVAQGENITYYDGEIYIQGFSEDYGSGQFWICDRNGNVLSEIYDWIYFYMEEQNPQPVEAFYGKIGDTLYKLGRDGKAQAEVTLEGLADVTAYPQGVVCMQSDWENTALLDADLNVIIPFDVYTNITVLHDWDFSANTGYWAASYSTGSGLTRQCILKSDGTRVIEGLSEYGLLKDGVIPVNRGQAIGLMDLEGNWVIQIPKDTLYNSD